MRWREWFTRVNSEMERMVTRVTSEMEIMVTRVTVRWR